VSQRIAIFGGSYNPPQSDHALLVQALLNRMHESDEVWVLPVVSHAFGKELLPYEHRAAMCEAMCKCIQRNCSIVGNRAKVVRREETYMIDTLEALRKEHPGVELVLAVGGDVLHDTSKWHRWDDITKLATIMPFVRKGETVPEGFEPLDVGSRGYSSTEIREQLAKGDLTHLLGDHGKLPSAVLDYIEEHNLYGYTKPTWEPSCQLDTVLLTLTEVTRAAKPGEPFQLTGDVHRVYRVSPDPWKDRVAAKEDAQLAVKFHIVRDNQVHQDTHRQYRRWLCRQTDAWAQGKKFEEPEPVAFGPLMVYFKVGGEPLAHRFNAVDYLGCVEEYEFFLCGPVPDATQGIFGSLFGFGGRLF
jgi:nicotinate-nucleotide adenylyltransferase